MILNTQAGQGNQEGLLSNVHGATPFPDLEQTQEERLPREFSVQRAMSRSTEAKLESPGWCS